MSWHVPMENDAMNTADVVTALFTAVAAIAAIAAVVVAVRARGTSASANTTAKDANAIARGARDAAETSNEIATKANKISNQAIQDAREAQLKVTWHDMLRAVNRFLNINPSTEDIGPAFTEMRVSAILLSDELKWPGLDKWLAQEQVLAATIGRDCDLQYQRNRPQTPEAVVEIFAPMHTWAATYLSNLRYLRERGPDSAEADQVSQLAEIAAERQRGIYTRNGWGTPPTELDGIEPLGRN